MPNVPDPPWWSRRTEAPRDKRPLTRELIVDAALVLLERDGLQGLSMRRLAHELDSGAASLYWHVGDKEGAFHSARHGSGVVNHFFQCHLGSVFVTKHNHSDGIANENDVDPTFVEQPCRWIIVGGQRCNTFAPQLFISELLH